MYEYFLNVVVWIIFSSILQIWYVEIRISRSISESPLEFEITRGDCSTEDAKESPQSQIMAYITKTYLYNFDPLKPHFYIVKLGFTGVYISFLISAKNIDCGYSLEPHCRGGSNEYPQSMFLAEIWKISEFFYLKIFIFLVVKFSVYLNRLVFVMYKLHKEEK